MSQVNRLDIKSVLFQVLKPVLWISLGGLLLFSLILYLYAAKIDLSLFPADATFSETNNEVFKHYLILSIVLVVLLILMFIFTLVVCLNTYVLKPIQALLHEIQNFDLSKSDLPMQFEGQYQYEFREFVKKFNVVTQRLDQKVHAASELRKKIQSITQEVPVLLSFLDENRRYVFANQHYQEVYGLPYQSFLNQTLRYGIDDETYFKLLPQVEKAYEGQMVCFSYDWHDKSGHKRFFCAHFKPNIGDNGQVDGCFVSIEDKTEEKYALIELSEQKRSAEHAVNALSRFVATISYELRTPLDEVMGMLRLIDKEEMNVLQKQRISMIISSISAVTASVSRLLDFSRFESGTLVLEKREFNIRRLIKDGIEAYLPRIEERGLVLKLELGKFAFEEVTADPIRVQQILQNLMDNAIKFTRRGSISVFAEVLVDDLSRATLYCTVSDTGVGIGEDFHESIFQGYANLSYGSSSGPRKDLGLGLSMCRKLCQLMGGDMKVSSAVGQGSEFSFWCAFEEAGIQGPVAQAPSDNQTQRGYDDMSSPMLGITLRVLIVEDDLFNQETALGILEVLGHLAQVVNHGVEALDALSLAEHGHYDMIFMDCNMPHMDGFETTQLIRKGRCGSYYKSIPIIAMTASTSESDRLRCLRLGMSDYMSKPISTAAVLEKLNLWSGDRLKKIHG